MAAPSRKIERARMALDAFNRRDPEGYIAHVREDYEWRPFMFAGVWTKWLGDRGTNGAPNVGEHRLYSIMTTEANAVVQPVDDVMPVILTTVAEVEQWLTGSVEEALALQRPAADDVIKLLADEKKAA